MSLQAAPIHPKDSNCLLDLDLGLAGHTEDSHTTQRQASTPPTPASPFREPPHALLLTQEDAVGVPLFPVPSSSPPPSTPTETPSVSSGPLLDAVGYNTDVIEPAVPSADAPSSYSQPIQLCPRHESPDRPQVPVKEAPVTTTAPTSSTIDRKEPAVAIRPVSKVRVFSLSYLRSEKRTELPSPRCLDVHVDPLPNE